MTTFSENPLQFIKLNEGWNAEPNACWLDALWDHEDLVIEFPLSAYSNDRLADGDMGRLRFRRCERYRVGPENDHAWYDGQCRYSGRAPEWGEFYELVGYDRLALNPNDWRLARAFRPIERHFLFYFRDEMFECFASDWTIDPSSSNALYAKLHRWRP